MAIFHVHAAKITKGSGNQIGGFARYLREGVAREGQRWLTPAERRRTDLMDKGHGHLPLWAKDSDHFWAMAQRFERKGGMLGLHYQVSLPRELSECALHELSADMRAAFWEQYPHTWALHRSHASDGADNPHLHVLFSTRREDGMSARLPKAWFAKAAPEGEYRIHAGVKKDHAWYGRLDAVRRETAVLINAALEREGLALAVSAQSLKDRGIDRAVSPYDAAAENLVNLKAWHLEKQRRHIAVDREAVLDLVRDRFWAHDQSVCRVQQRQESLSRTLARVEVLSHRPPYQETQAERRQRLEQVVRSHAHVAWLRHPEAQVTQGLRARLRFDDDEERRVGYGR
jgi:MobA/MobL family protein